MPPKKKSTNFKMLEREVLTEIRSGLSHKEVAEKHGIGIDTVVGWTRKQDNARTLKNSGLLFQTIESDDGEIYHLNGQIDEGISGIVFGANREPTKGQGERKLVAVKFYLFRKQGSTVASSLQAFLRDYLVAEDHTYTRELKALGELHHPGIQDIIGFGLIKEAKSQFVLDMGFAIPHDNQVRYVISEYIEGSKFLPWVEQLAKTAKNAPLPERKRLRDLLIGCLIDLLEALVYIHEKCQYQHSDIQSSNILIHKETQRPILIDFGFSQVFSDALIVDAPHTQVPPLPILGCPEELSKEILDAFGSDTGKVDRAALRRILFPHWDLFKFGKLLKEFLAAKGVRDLISPLDYAFITSISNDLTQWSSAKQSRTSEVRDQLRKLQNGYWSALHAAYAPHLLPGQQTRSIALPERSFIAPLLVEQILETQSFRRLQRLKQLALLDYVYPGATQTRFEHSLAVYSNAVDLVGHLVRSPRFTKIFDTRSLSTLLITALVHDINHIPFLHYLQEIDHGKVARKNLFQFFIHRKESDKSLGFPRIPGHF